MILILPSEREIGVEAGTTGLGILGFLEIIIRIRNKLRHFLFILVMVVLKLEQICVLIIEYKWISADTKMISCLGR